MKKNIIVVCQDGSWLSVNNTVANDLGIHDGYRVKNEADLWRIIAANAEYGIFLCEGCLNSN